MTTYEIYGRGHNFISDLLEIVEISAEHAVKRAVFHATHYSNLYVEINIVKVVKTDFITCKTGG